MLIGLTLAGSTAGGVTVGTGFECLAEATTKVEASDARNGPKGTAAEYRAQKVGEGCAGPMITEWCARSDGIVGVPRSRR